MCSKALWPQTGKTSLEGAPGGTDRQKQAPELWARLCPIRLKASHDVAETAGEVANTDAIISEMGKPRQKVTQGHRQQKSSVFRKQTQSFSITQSPLQCIFGGIKNSPQPLSAGMMLQHRVHISKQSNRSSLLSSSPLPPP